MNKITINGVLITGGRNITMRNGKVLVDGVDVTPDTKEISVVINGDVEKLEADSCLKISITGDVGSVKTLSGDVDISGTINGYVQTMSGDVKCGGSINGSVSTMSGDIRHR